ncbi:RNA polymerase sigma-70 factor, ECF subfamily [Cyclonatronum proteinivorum]|uniref:RNA polymerase sigma factor n=1 Tax=Cyclonatronum proteinivorum TaxID=1457365 RepID=A0A345UKU3_9BACT|nr:sigma-70 family RNA polymerase sigma factor [Cyclonatronum proteinivorum]AXJ01095.1 RNA polymerase sigma-70 factor, ECF subfamily [Cyclonatronum proteinivorum]
MSAESEAVKKARSLKNREEDYALVDQAKLNDQKAFARLMEKYQVQLHFHVQKIVRDRDVVEDLVQEAFLKAFDNIHTFDPTYAFSTWLYRIATNHSIDFLRKKKMKTYSIDEPVRGKDGDMKVELPDHDSETDAELIRKQRAKIIKEAIDSLPDKYRVIIKLRHEDDKSYQEIADMMTLPLGTVKAHIFRARELLNKFLIEKRGQF